MRADARWTGPVILDGINARVGAQANSKLTLSGEIKDGTGSTLFVTPNATSGAVVISGTANTYTGPTSIVRGKLSLGADNALPAGTVVDVHALTTPDNATFDLAGFRQTVAGLRRSGSGGTGTVVNSGAELSELTVLSTVDTSYDGTISGLVRLTKSGPVAPTLRAPTPTPAARSSRPASSPLDNTTGNAIGGGELRIEGGTLRLDGDNQIGDADAVVMTGGELITAGRNETFASVAQSGGTRGGFAGADAGSAGTTTTVTGTYALTGGQLTVGAPAAS